MQYLVDTNVVIQMLRGNAGLTSFVDSLNAIIDTTVYVETLQGQKSNREKNRVKKLLNSFPFIRLAPEISQRTIEIIDKYSNSHNLLLPDAQIAACCLEYDFILLTYNLKDFRFIDGLKTEVPAFPQI